MKSFTFLYVTFAPTEKKRLKILFAMNSWVSGNSVALQCKAIADELTARGQDVIALLPPENLPQEENFHIQEWPSRRPINFRDALFYWKLCRQYHPDIVLTQFAPTNIMLWIGALCGVKIRAVWYHTILEPILLDRKKGVVDIHTQLQILRKRIVYKFATHIVPVSEYAKGDISRYFGVSKKKCKVFHNAVESSSSLSEEKPIQHMVRFFARIDPCKGVDILLKAWKIVVSEIPKATLELYGRGNVTESEEEFAAFNVHFKGTVPPSQVRTLMRSAMLTVLPSRMDNCPLAVIESLAEGTPVVATNVGGIPEIITHGENGFLVEPEKEDELAQAIIMILQDMPLREKLSMGARTKHISQFEVSRYANRVADWLENL